MNENNHDTHAPEKCADCPLGPTVWTRCLRTDTMEGTGVPAPSPKCPYVLLENANRRSEFHQQNHLAAEKEIARLRGWLKALTAKLETPIFPARLNMQISDKGLQFIARFEGFRSKPYRCPAGVPTIGYGHTAGVHMSDPPITKDDALDLLRDDVSRFEKAVSDAVRVPLTQSQFDALVSFAFNVGAGALRRSTLLKLLNQHEPAHVVAAEFLRWNKAGGKVLNGLTRRREAERTMFLRGLA